MNDDPAVAVRRERFGHRRQGTGRQTTVRAVELNFDGAVGRRTGVKIKSNVAKGEDGFEDISDFWEEGEDAKMVPPKTPPRSTRSNVAGSPRTPVATPNDAADRNRTPSRVRQTPPPAIAQTTPDQFFDVDGSPPDQDEVVAKASPARRSPGRKQSQQASVRLPAPEAEHKQEDGDMSEPSSKRETVRKQVGSRKTASVASRQATPPRPNTKKSSVSRDDDEGGPVGHLSGGEDDDEDEPFQPSPEASPQRPHPPRKSLLKKMPAKPKQTPIREDSEQDESDEDVKAANEPLTPGNAILSPGFDNRRLKKSIKKKAHHDSDDDDEDGATRRSSRRRWPVLAYWKGERVLYTDEGAKRAEIVGVLTPDLEPQRRKIAKRMKNENSEEKSKKPSKKRALSLGEDDDEPVVTATAAMKPFRIPPHLKESESAGIMLKDGDKTVKMAVVRRKDQIRMQDLPGAQRVGGRPVPLAGAAFNCGSFISGVIRLLPRTGKDEESTDFGAQVFYVSKCQPRALQVDIGNDESSLRRFFLSEGDHFFVPVTTVYKMYNHSESVDADVTFVVVTQKP